MISIDSSEPYRDQLLLLQAGGVVEKRFPTRSDPSFLGQLKAGTTGETEELGRIIDDQLAILGESVESYFPAAEAPRAGRDKL